MSTILSWVYSIVFYGFCFQEAFLEKCLSNVVNLHHYNYNQIDRMSEGGYAILPHDGHEQVSKRVPKLVLLDALKLKDIL